MNEEEEEEEEWREIETDRLALPQTVFAFPFFRWVGFREGPGRARASGQAGPLGHLRRPTPPALHQRGDPRSATFHHPPTPRPTKHLRGHPFPRLLPPQGNCPPPFPHAQVGLEISGAQ